MSMHSKRSLTVIKELEPPSPKKKLYVTHKLDASCVTDDDFRESLKGNPSPQKATRRADGSYIPWSILGDGANYEHLESGGGSENQSGSVSVRTSRSSRSRNKTGSRTGKKSPNKGQVVAADPNQELKDHIDSLVKFKSDALKVRNNERVEEEMILTKLPVHEKFSLNKEGKAISKWQERLNDWSKIESRLARRVGGSTKTLLMNSGDEYRGKNEEYDIMQAAIPIEEKFGPNSWMMMLRGGGEQNVPVGHIFSGLVCKVTTKQTIPKMLRKPLLGSEPRTKDSFLDGTPALTIKRDKLKSKIETIRPYSMGPSVADGLIVFSTNLYDWAHDSSKRILIEREENERYEEQMKQQALLEEQQKHAGHVVEDPTSSLRVLSATNLLFTCLKGEGVGNMFTFSNTGRATITYSWTCDVNRYEEVNRPVWNVLENREEKPREYVLAKDRSMFFCPRSTGRVLPGETVHTSFIYCNRNGGSVSEQWVLQLSPQATVTYVDPLKREGDQSSPTARDAMPPTSKLAVQLRGQSYTLDESGYRRREASNRVQSGTEEAFTRDQILQCVRRVRPPLRPAVLQKRKVDFFLQRNASVLHELSDIFGENLPLHLTYRRLLEFEACHISCQSLVSEMHGKCKSVLKQWRDLSGSAETEVPDANLGKSGALLLADMSKFIFPEQSLEFFDEVTEEDVTPAWDYDLTRILAICHSTRDIVARIIEIEEKIKEKTLADEKEAVRAARRAAAGSDDESEEEEEEEDDDEPKPIVVHPLVAQLDSAAANVHSLMRRLIVEPMVLPDEDAKNALLGSLDLFEDIELASRSVADIAVESIIPVFPSPFTSEEGKAAWDAALKPPPEPEDTGKKGKKAPEKKDKKKDKGAANEIPIVEPEQANIFYRDLCNKVVGSIVDNLVDNMFAVVDARLVNEANQRVASSSTVSDLAVLRPEDVPEKGLVFVSVMGQAFFGKKKSGAFDVNKEIRTRSVEPIILAANSGASGVVVIFESRSESEVVVVESTTVLQEALAGAAIFEAQVQEKARPKPRKKDPPLPSIVPVKFKVSVVSNFAELDVALQKLQGEDISKKKSFPVFVLQDIRSASVVPKDMNLPDEVEDDDDCPIPVGIDEYHARRLTQWNEAGPKKVAVQTAAGVIETYAGSAAALADIVTRSCSSAHGVWVECNPAVLYAPQSVSPIQECAHSLAKSGILSCTRVLSGGMRDLASWFSVIPQIPRIPDIIELTNTTDSSCDAYAHHLYNLFKECQESSPKLLAVLGGSLRLDKFMILDKLLDSAAVIYLAGELCIPFLAMSRCVELSRYTEVCDSYRIPTLEIMAKARLRGVKLLLPTDIVEGDEAVSTEQRNICFNNIEPGARDEGADYPGETKTVQLPDYVVEEGVYADVTPLKINGYLLDMGPVSCQELKLAVESSEMLFSWGTLGCVEMSSFQAAQRILVTTAAKKPYSEDDEPAAIAANAATLPLYTLVAGDSCVEWWSRISDSEGEYNGEISRCGIVSCASRDSSVVCGFLSSCQSASISNMSKREAGSDEWIYNARPPPPPDEDEEEDDDEDEDD